MCNGEKVICEGYLWYILLLFEKIIDFDFFLNKLGYLGENVFKNIFGLNLIRFVIRCYIKYIYLLVF